MTSVTQHKCGYAHSLIYLVKSDLLASCVYNSPQTAEDLNSGSLRSCELSFIARKKPCCLMPDGGVTLMGAESQVHLLPP